MIFGCIKTTPILILWSVAVSIGPSFLICDLWLYPDGFHTLSMLFGFYQSTPILTLWSLLYLVDFQTHSMILSSIKSTSKLTLWYLAVSSRLPYTLYALWLYPDASHNHSMIFGCIHSTLILTLWSSDVFRQLPYSFYTLFISKGWEDPLQMQLENILL